MTKSPLQFAKDFARLQGQLAASPSGDSQLLLALDFWQEMREYRGDAAYQSYFDEYLPLLSRLSDKGNLIDLTIAELTRLRDVLAEFDGERSRMVVMELAKQYFYVGAVEDGLAALTTKHGAPPLAVGLDSSAGEGLVGQNPLGFDEGGVDEVSSPRRRGTSSSADEALDSRFRGNNRKRNVGQNPLGSDSVGQNEFVAFQTTCARATEINHPLAATLNDILTDWQGEREAVYHDRVRCLFVERDDSGSRVRGRMRTLVGKVDLFGKSARTDEITFDNVIKTPDDPFVGVAYSALAAVRKIFGGFSVGQNPRGFDRGGDTPVGREPRAPDRGGDSVGQAFLRPDKSGKSQAPRGLDLRSAETWDSRFRGNDREKGGNDKGNTSKPQGFRPTIRSSQATHFYHAHYSIEDSAQTFTGDSIGLAFGLLAYVQLIRPEISRLDRLLSGEVAFTGGVDSDGKLTAVNDETLGQKIERAFFSPVKYAVLPEANAAAAKQHLDRLRKLYPRRNLHLIAAERLTDIIEDHNIVRSEKVCIGEFVAKKAAKYGRMTKVQVPLLLLLAYLLVCLLYPKAWVGFDWNPARISFDVLNNSIDVFNRGSEVLWSRKFDCTLSDTSSSYGVVSDITGDGKNEVLCMPPTEQSCWDRAVLFCLSPTGVELFRRHCQVPRSIIGDSGDVLFAPQHVSVIDLDGQITIITEVAQAIPIRSHIRFWNSRGDSLCYFLNPGGTKFLVARDLNDDDRSELFFLNYFNPVPCVSLLVLDAEFAWGNAPPYPYAYPKQRKEQPGTFLACILFPVTDLARKDVSSGYSQPGSFKESHDGQIDFYVGESGADPYADVIYSVGKDFRVVSIAFTGEFIKRRNELAGEGKLPLVDWKEYGCMLHDSVMYWKDSCWVTEAQLKTQGR